MKAGDSLSSRVPFSVQPISRHTSHCMLYSIIPYNWK